MTREEAHALAFELLVRHEIEGPTVNTLGLLADLAELFMLLPNNIRVLPIREEARS